MSARIISEGRIISYMEITYSDGKVKLNPKEDIDELAVVLKSDNSEYIYLPESEGEEQTCYGYTQGNGFVYKSREENLFTLDFPGDFNKVREIELIFEKNNSCQNVSINF